MALDNTQTSAVNQSATDNFGNNRDRTCSSTTQSD